MVRTSRTHKPQSRPQTSLTMAKTLTIPTSTTPERVPTPRTPPSRKRRSELNSSDRSSKRSKAKHVVPVVATKGPGVVSTRTPVVNIQPPPAVTQETMISGVVSRAIKEMIERGELVSGENYTALVMRHEALQKSHDDLAALIDDKLAYSILSPFPVGDSEPAIEPMLESFAEADGDDWVGLGIKFDDNDPVFEGLPNI